MAAVSKTLEARRRARQRDIVVGAHTYTITRPRAADMVRDMTRIDLINRFVVGWSLCNADLVPGGDPEPEPFDAELFADWVADQPDIWVPLAEAILEEWNRYAAAQEATEKN